MDLSMIRQQSLINYSIHNALLLQNLQFQHIHHQHHSTHHQHHHQHQNSKTQNTSSYQAKKDLDVIRPEQKKTVKLRSFLIEDILESDFSTPLNALEQLTCKKAFHRSGTEFSAILGQNAQIKKKRKNRTAFTTYQLNELEKRFNFQKYLTPADRDVIAEQLGLTSTQVITWFQNRRAKLKRDVDDTKTQIKSEASTSPLPISTKRKRDVVASDDDTDINDTDVALIKRPKC